jgi:MGT family glycosyltransferase
MRVLFVVPPLTGHVNPTVSVAHALRTRGHRVAWVAHPRAVASLLPSDATVFPLDDEVPEALLQATQANANRVRGLQAFRFLWEDFLLPLARASVAGVQSAINTYEPDVVVVDQQALAGAIVCRQQDIPWAMFATTSAGVTDPLAGLPRVREWLDAQLDLLQKEQGLDPVKHPDRSPLCNIVFSSVALVGDEASTLPTTMHFVGPAALDRPSQDAAFPWELLQDGPRVLVSLGTVNPDRGARFYATAVEAVRDKPVQAIMVAPEGMIDDPPPNVLVRSYVPQLALLAHMDAVVCHAGHNTVCESLLNGLPLVLTPIKDDQPVVAQQVVDAGAGLRLRFGRLRPADLWEAIDSVLHTPTYREAAKRLQDSFQQAGGSEKAVELLEGLL